jgi:uncharacterized LabA/DUF88 family protein
MKRAGIFVDLGNLHYFYNNKFNKKIDYAKYLASIQSRYNVVYAYAYTSQNDVNQKFTFALKELGFIIKYKSPRQIKLGEKVIEIPYSDYLLCLDVMRLYNKLDVIVLGSNDPVHASMLQRLDCDVLVMASSVHAQLKPYGYIELNEDYAYIKEQNNEIS